MRKCKFKIVFKGDWQEGYFHQWGLGMVEDDTKTIGVVEDLHGNVFEISFVDWILFTEPHIPPKEPTLEKLKSILKNYDYIELTGKDSMIITVCRKGISAFSYTRKTLELTIEAAYKEYVYK